jgi:NADPH:quinone reductase-like Zn-dependent oxidoreductase
MRAAVRHTYGGPVTVEEIDPPQISEDEVLVEVHAAGLDRGVLHLLEGTPYALRLVYGMRRPKNPVLGLDVAGRVVEVGSAVSGFAVGEQVCGIARGAFAELAAAPAAKLVHRPAQVGVGDAAALPVSGLTGLQAVREAGVQAGQRVAVLGASGGVGTYVVQIAKGAGAQVTAVCSPGKADLVRDLGADEVLDYANPLPTGAFDVVFAIGGNQPVRQLRAMLVDRGLLLVVGGEGGGQITGIGRQIRAVLWNPLVRQRMAMLVSEESGADLQILMDMVLAGTVRPVVGARYPLERAGEALADMAAGRLRGKAVIDVV